MEGTNTLIAWIKAHDRDQLIRQGFRILFFLFVWFYLGIVKQDLLYKLHESNYFLFDELYVKDLLSMKSGLLLLISRFIQQFSCYPLLGAAIFALMISGMELLISKVFSIKKEWFIVAFIPSFALLFMAASITYEILDSFEFSYPFSNIIGFFYAILIFFIYKKTEEKIWASPLIVVVTAITTIWVGPGTLLAILMIGTDALFGKKYLKGTVSLLLGSLAIFLTAKYSSYHVTPAYMVYSILHPWPNAYYPKLHVVTLVSHAVAVLALTSYQTYQAIDSKKIKQWINPVIGILLFATTIIGCKYPYALKQELRLERLAHEMQFKQMVEEMEDMDISSRLLAAYRVVALIGTDQLSEKIFNYNYAYCRPGFFHYGEEIGFYPEILFYASFPQISYRWCMEANTDSYKRPYLFQLMALCAFVNEEYKLARRYCNLLAETFYYRNWAKEMLNDLNNPEEYIKKYPILASIKKARPFTEITGAIKGVAGIYDPYMALPNVCAERRILTKLYRRKLNEVETEVKLSRYMKTGIPRCIQEGLILKAILTNNIDMLKNFPIDQDVYDFVCRFVEYYKRHYKEKDVALQMKEKFGYCYCHYFSFGVGANIPTKKKSK